MSTITQARIASQLGISRSAVAKALHATLHTQISPERRQSIRDAAQKMGYVPNRSARSLKLGRTHNLVVATSEEVYHTHIYDLIQSLQKASAAHDYQVTLQLVPRVADFNQLLHPSTRTNAAGVIFLGTNFLREHRYLLNERPPVPVVLIGFNEYSAVSSVTYDRAKATELGVAHLLAQGHRRVAMVQDAQDGPVPRLKLQGYRAALRQAGLEVTDELIFPSRVDGDASELWARIAATSPRPTAVISVNDELAFRLLYAMLRAGARVPDDVALVALANSRLTMMAEVPVTALDMNNTAIAKTAVEILLAQIQNPTVPARQVLVDPFLVVRASSAKPKETPTTKERQ